MARMPVESKLCYQGRRKSKLIMDHARMEEVPLMCTMFIKRFFFFNRLITNFDVRDLRKKI